MDYVWIKGIHVAAALVLTGGLFVQTLVLVAISGGDGTSGSERSIARAVHDYDRKVTTPALLVVWAMGLWAAASAGWLGDHWLSIKLVIVVALSALHGVQSGALRRVAAGAPAMPMDLRWRVYVLLLAVTIIAVLVVVKPFS